MILNWALVKHPLNWVIVFLMVAIGIIVVNLLLTPWHIPQKGSVGLSPNSEPVDLQFSQ